PFPFRLIDEKEQAIRTQIDSLTEALETDRDDYIVWQKRGVLYNDLGEYERAVVDFTESLAVNPKTNKKKKPESYAYLFYAYFSRGISYIQQESFEEAIEDFSSAITVAEEMKGYDSTVQASLAAAFLERGYSYAVEQNFTPAKSDLKRVLALSDSLDCEVYPLLVDIGLEEKNNQDLVDAYTGMISCRESINQFYSRGYYRSEIEDYAGAIEDMKKVQAESNSLPLRIAAHNRISYCQLKLGDLGAARTAVTEALDINAVNNLSHYYLGMILEAEGKPDEACSSMRKALYFGLGGPEGDAAKAFLNEKCGGWEE
ncbi:MAG: tetratricopeptide repeat protein, partial [Bacteroidota bacterium]